MRLLVAAVGRASIPLQNKTGARQPHSFIDQYYLRITSNMAISRTIASGGRPPEPPSNQLRLIGYTPDLTDKLTDAVLEAVRAQYPDALGGDQ